MSLLLILLAACGTSESEAPKDEVADWVCKQALIETAEVVEQLPEKTREADPALLDRAIELAEKSAEACRDASQKQRKRAWELRDGLKGARSLVRPKATSAAPSAVSETDAPRPDEPAMPPGPAPTPEAAPLPQP